MSPPSSSPSSQLRADLDALEDDAKRTVELNRGSHHPDMSAYTHAVRLERVIAWAKWRLQTDGK